MKVVIVESDDIKYVIDKYIYSNNLVLFKSSRFDEISVYPYSNIIFVPSSLTDKILKLLDTYFTRYRAIKRSDVKSITNFIETSKTLTIYI